MYAAAIVWREDLSLLPFAKMRMHTKLAVRANGIWQLGRVLDIRGGLHCVRFEVRMCISHHLRGSRRGIGTAACTLEPTEHASV